MSLICSTKSTKGVRKPTTTPKREIHIPLFLTLWILTCSSHQKFHITNMKFDLKISQTGLVDWVFYTHHSPIWISLISTKLKLMISRYSDSLQAGRSGDQIPVGAKFSAPIQTGPGARPASYGKGNLVACSRVNFTFTLLIRKAFWVTSSIPSLHGVSEVG